jgi:TolB-like protein
VGGAEVSRAAARLLALGVWCAGTAGPALAQCPDGSPPPCARPAAGARAAPPATSVAVLYFDNASRDTADAYLADGITEEIISRLGQVARIQVKSRYLVRRYRGGMDEDPATIGRTLGVASIVTGSVRRGGNRVRVTAEMVRTASGDVVWSERYDRDDADVLTLQGDLASAVATAIAGRLAPAERQALAAQPTRSREAWDRFVRGNYFLARRTPEAHARAVEEFVAAAQLDPGFTRARARAGYAYGVAAWRSDPVNGLAPDSSSRLARQAADRAVRADPRSSDAWMALSVAQLQRPESLAAARVSAERALALDTANAEAEHVHAWTLFYQGRTDDAVAAWRRALALEPGRPITLATLGWVAGIGRHWAEAERLYDSAVVFDPGFLQAYRQRAVFRFENGDTAGMRADNAALAALTRDGSYDSVSRALTALRAGDSTVLRGLVEREARTLSSPDGLDDDRFWRLAEGFVRLGEPDRALDWLERVLWKNTNFYSNLLPAPFDRMRGIPRYERLLDQWRVPAGFAGQER